MEEVQGLDKDQNLDIPKQAHVYIIYYGLHPEYRNMIDSLASEIVMKMNTNDTCELYGRIAKNQAN